MNVIGFFLSHVQSGLRSLCRVRKPIFQAAEANDRVDAVRHPPLHVADANANALDDRQPDPPIADENADAGAAEQQPDLQRDLEVEYCGKQYTFHTRLGTHWHTNNRCFGLRILCFFRIVVSYLAV